MVSTFENKLTLGNGIYTVNDIAQILQLPSRKVNTWIKKYWDGKLGQAYESKYSWSVNNTKAVGFHTLVEFYVMVQFAKNGVSTGQVLKAHKHLSEQFKTPFPFAHKDVERGIRTDGKKIFFTNDEGDILSLDGSRQFNLDLITIFFKKLDFDQNTLASRFWPMGKEHKIVCDPHHRFGQAVIHGTNIQAEALYRMHLTGEPVKVIASLYEIKERYVQDAIKFYNNAA